MKTGQYLFLPLVWRISRLTSAKPETPENVTALAIEFRSCSVFSLVKEILYCSISWKAKATASAESYAKRGYGPPVRNASSEADKS